MVPFPLPSVECTSSKICKYHNYYHEWSYEINFTDFLLISASRTKTHSLAVSPKKFLESILWRICKYSIINHIHCFVATIRFEINFPEFFSTKFQSVISDPLRIVLELLKFLNNAYIVLILTPNSNLRANQLDGTIPDTIGLCNKLLVFNVENNRMTGTLPDSIGALPLLQELVLRLNRFTGSVPASVNNLNNLRSL